jgi:hypothetical protein
MPKVTHTYTHTHTHTHTHTTTHIKPLYPSTYGPCAVQEAESADAKSQTQYGETVCSCKVKRGGVICVARLTVGLRSEQQPYHLDKDCSVTIT